MLNTNMVTAQPADQAYSAKNNYLGFLRRYLQHKNKLSEVSSYYFNSGRGRSLAMCNNTFNPMFRDSAGVTLKKICELVLSHHVYLTNILPAPKNGSYKSSCEKLEYIIATAKSFAL